jgi:hypothetical protein
MDPGGELTVRVADLPEGGGRTLLVEATDTGPGIAGLQDRTPPLVLSRAKAANGDISISLTKGRLN